MSARLAAAVVVAWAALAIAAPWLAPNDPHRKFEGRMYAPPTRVHVLLDGRISAPYFLRQRLVHPLERRYVSDPAQPIVLAWFNGGRLVSGTADDPLLLLGGDGLGRDVFSRVLHGARVSLALAFLAALGATVLGALAGGVAGLLGGVVDALLTRLSEFILVLPALYLLIVLRAALPLVMPPLATFLLTAVIFTAVGWPFAARGVRAIVSSERRSDYVEAAFALGSSRRRVLLRHVLPAAGSFLRMQATLLVPACILAEATLSFAGLGFPEELPSWGTLLQEAANVGVLASAPWLLAPAAAIFSIVLPVNVLASSRGARPFDTAGPVG